MGILNRKPVGSSRTYFQSDGITYEILSENTVQIGNGENKAVDFNKTVVSIPDYVSYGERDYKVIGISGFAFYGCDDLLMLKLPDGLSYIGKMAFAFCNSLALITLPAALRDIDDGVFYQCQELKSVVILSCLENVGSGVFSFCENLETIVCNKMSQCHTEKLFGKDHTDNIRYITNPKSRNGVANFYESSHLLKEIVTCKKQ